MAIQKIIDPSDPQSVARLLNRVNKLENSNALNTAKLKKAQVQLNETAALSYQGQGVNNLAFNYDGATSLTWAAAFINDKQGNQYQIPSGSATVVNGTSYNVVFNPEHPTLVITTTAIATVLAEPNSLLACTLYLTSANTSFGPGGTGSPANGSVNGLNFGSASASATTYKLENIQYTPVTFVSSAGGAFFTYALPANELALGQALRISFTGNWTNTSGIARTYTFTLKAGATTLLTWILLASNAATSNAFMAKQILVICTAAGSSGTIEVQAIDPPGPITGGTNPTAMSGTANTAAIAFDTTTIQSLTVNVVQTNDATTATSGRQWMVERLG